MKVPQVGGEKPQSLERKNWMERSNLISPKAFIHPQALVDPGASVGAGTRVWAFTHVVKGAVVGEDCNICDYVFIEGKVILGNRVTVKCGALLWDGIVVEDDVFIGPGAVFTNDLLPRSKQYPKEFRRTILRQGSSIGANATILPGLTVGRWSMAGAGAVVTRDVLDYALVLGNPARQRGWICRCAAKLAFDAEGAARCACGRFYRLNAAHTVREGNS